MSFFFQGQPSGGPPISTTPATYWYSARAGTTNPFSMTVNVTKVHFEENITTNENPGDWDDTDHDFTCSSPGLYLITGVYGIRFGDDVAASVWLNNSEYKRLYQASNSAGVCPFSLVMQLALSDVVDFRQWTYGGRINGDSHRCQLEIVKIG